MDESYGGMIKAVDVVKIIKACSEHGVKQFSLGSLEFTLGAGDNETKVKHEPVVSYGQDYMMPIRSAVNHVQEELDEQEITPEMELEIQEQRMQEMLIADPLAHEELAEKQLDGEGLE